MRTYCAYFRTSKDSFKAGKSKSNGLGLEAQESIVRHFYKDSIVKEYTEVKSAKNISERPILQQAINFCIQEKCWLVVAKLDRLSRNVDDIRFIHKKLNRKISFCDIPSENEVDLFTITLYSAFAERERELISLRTSQALQAKLKREGKWNHGSELMNNGSLNKLAVKVIKQNAASNENSIRASELISSKLNEGFTYTKIANLLNQKKFLTPNGYLFHPAQVQRIERRFA